ncbi:MAG: HpcH/HpaI aldolase family protein [Paracoccaceae bacterium]
MIPNRLRQIWAEGRTTANGWLSIGNAFSAEIMAAQGYDSLTVDMQHGALDYAAFLPMLQAMRASGVVPLARVPWLEPGIIMKSLDAGAYGVICPMVNTPEDAARFVSYTRYTPEGQRSFGPTRATYSAGGNYAAEANRQMLAIAMIETAEALANLDTIVATPGLDGIYVGPADLTMSLTRNTLPSGFDREEPEMIAALQRIASACGRAGIVAGLHCGTAEYAVRAIGWGYRMATIGGSDARLLAAAAGANLSRFRELQGGAAKPAEAKSGY